MDTLTIGGRKISADQPSFVIAEAGSNHNRDLDTALRLIDAAAAAGADTVKFQIFRAESLYSRYTPRLSEMEGRSEPGETPFELIRRFELPREWLPQLAAQARKNGIFFTASPFDLEAVKLMEAIDVPFYKVASYEIVDVILLRAIAETGKPAIVSTGNSSLADIEAALKVFAGCGNDQVALLHCVSQYPTRYADLNLRCIPTMQRAFRRVVGFSDHTMDARAALAAVALGARILEKHFTLSRNQAGPDHPSSLEPGELAQYVRDVREIEQSLGNGVKRVMDSESENHQLARRSVHARIPIGLGTRIEAEMLCVKRPALGIDPREIERVVGRVARTDIPADAWITWDMV
jgi:N,N'-diacetyllegionaminate synthase